MTAPDIEALVGRVRAAFTSDGMCDFDTLATVDPSRTDDDSWEQARAVKALIAALREQAGEIGRLKNDLTAHTLELRQYAGRLIALQARVRELVGEVDGARDMVADQAGKYGREIDALRAEVEELTRDCQNINGWSTAAEKANKELRAENEGLRKDAERYRWIKSLRNRQMTWDSDNIVWVGKENLGDLDKVADAHIAATQRNDYAAALQSLNALRAEVEQQRRHHENRDDASMREINALRAENEGLRKDAERYRWLRSAGLSHINFDGLTPDTSDLGMDWAIDTAMSAGQYAMTDSIDSPQAPLK